MKLFACSFAMKFDINNVKCVHFHFSTLTFKNKPSGKRQRPCSKYTFKDYVENFISLVSYTIHNLPVLPTMVILSISLKDLTSEIQLHGTVIHPLNNDTTVKPK